MTGAHGVLRPLWNGSWKPKVIHWEDRIFSVWKLVIVSIITKGTWHSLTITTRLMTSTEMICK